MTFDEPASTATSPARSARGPLPRARPGEALLLLALLAATLTVALSTLGDDRGADATDVVGRPPS